jgi:signal transduction histidine kinase
VLLGVIVPLGLVGVWLSRSTRQSGEDLVRHRLETSLLDIANSVGFQWGAHRAALLDMAENGAVLAVLRDGVGVLKSQDALARRDLEQVWARLADVATSVSFLNLEGATVGHLDHGGDQERGSATAGSFDYVVPIHGPASGAQLGTLEVQLRTEQLLPPGLLTTGVSGSMLAVFDSRTGAPLTPLALDPELFAQSRFMWMGEDWIAVERRLREPALRLALAGPVGPFSAPFEAAARSGMLALLLVALLALLLVTLLVRRFTRSLLHLSDAAQAVAHGDLARRAKEEGPPEIKGTATAFNSMTESLRRTLQTLAQREAIAAVGEFAASLAHEVRNPLTSVRMDLQLTRAKVDDKAEAVALVDHALAEIDRLNASVGGFLRVARSGRTSPGRVDLRVQLEAAAHAARPRFEEQGARLEYSLPEEPIWVNADSGAVEQLLLNLLLNAADSLQPGERGGVSVEVTGESVEVAVWDEGGGISHEDMDRIFEPFFSTKEEGTGLGLAVAQRVARAHGAELNVESEPGEGTTFRFALPLAPTDSAAPP